MADWSTAIFNSQPFTLLANNINNFSLHPDLLEHLIYLFQPFELIARSYAQFIAVEARVVVMLGQLTQLQLANLPYAWQDQDFQPIGQAMDRLLRKVGVR